MAASSFLLILFLAVLCLLHCHAAANNLHRTRLLRPSPGLDSAILSTALAADPPPTRYFEVTKPIVTPPTEPCSYLVLHHQFANTYGQPPVLANYTPPSDLGCSASEFSKIVLEWTATCRGHQYDRIIGVWLGGVELLRSCTAVPGDSGIIWTVKKEITRYHSLLMKNNTLTVYLGNIVTEVYTGIYDVNITMHFYPAAAANSAGNSGIISPDSSHSIRGYHSNADHILPISRTLPLSDGLWFEIENATDTKMKKFTIPPNVYRAVLEVYVSFHENDEFWYGNPPNEYIEANNLTSAAGNGPFREVVVSLDGVTVGSVWPFTVIFTGGLNPFLWRPITGIGSFNLPTYDIEVTPFLSKILDGKPHELGFSVTNALKVWYIDANLHLWLDRHSKQTTSKLSSYSSTPLVYTSNLNFKRYDGKFPIKASRSIFAVGWVESSYGNITTVASQNFNFSHDMIMGEDANLQIIRQWIHYNDGVDLKTESSSVKLIRSHKFFPLEFYTNVFVEGNQTFKFVAKVTFAFIEKKKGRGSGFVTGSKLRNVQKAEAYMVVKDNLIVGGLGTTSEVYKFRSNIDCYFRNVSSSNYTILYDHVEGSCDEGRRDSVFGFGLEKRHGLYPFRRSFLGSRAHE